MNINTSAYTASSYLSSSAASGQKPGNASNTASMSKPGNQTDSVDISKEARSLQVYDAVSMVSNNSGTVSGKGLRRYANVGMGSGSTNLTAMNFSRKNLGSRIDSIIKSAGVKLSADEKLSISVDKDNKIVVGGLKDKKKAEAIQEALNKDKNLSREMRNHVAAGKINENAKRQEDFEQTGNMAGLSQEEIDEMFTSPNLRAYIIDDYLQQNTGLGLADLSLDSDGEGNVGITGINDTLKTLLSEDQALGATIAGMLERGETSSDFQVSFEFANGAIADPHSKEMAKSKVEGIKEALLGSLKRIDPETGERKLGTAEKFMNTLNTNGIDSDPAFERALSLGFRIQVDSSGGFEIVGLDDVDPKLKDSLANLLRQALDEWTNDIPDAMDAGGTRAPNMKDVYDAFIEEHKFEHGDTDEVKHVVEIDFSGTGQIQVLSPEADKAQDAKNQQLAGEMGKSLREMLGASGIDASNMEMEIDERGKITVSGESVAKADLDKAQEILDKFVEESKIAGKKAEDEEKTARAEAEKERREIHHGEDAEEPDSSVVKKAEAGESDPAAKEKVKDIRGNALSERDALVFDAWKRNAPQSNFGNHFLGFGGSVSGIGQPVFGTSAIESSDSDAQRLYMELRNGMNNFHDARSKIRYSM